MVAEGFEATHLEERGSWLGELATCLTQRGHRVLALATRALEPWQRAEEPAGVSVLRPAPATLDGTLLQLLQTRPDVVHLASRGPWGPAAAAALAGAPVVLDAHDFWPACANADLLRRPTLTPCPHHHGHPDCGACAGHSALRAMESRAGLGAAARAVITHAAWSRERLAEALGREVECVRLGVDTARFRPGPRAPLAPEVADLHATRERSRVLIAGHSLRGGPRPIDLLVALNARVPGIEIVVAGRDPSDPDADQVLLAEAREAGLTEQVRLLPAVSRGDLPALLAACPLLCVPGPLPGWGGLVVMQAMAAGLPVVAHPSAGAAELIDHDRSGLLIPAHEVGPFAQAVQSLLADEPRRARLAERARLAALEGFDLERAVFAHEDLYRVVRRAAEAPPGPRGRTAPRRAAA